MSQRAKSNALNTIVILAYPHLQAPRYQHQGSDEFKNRRKQLENRLAKGRNWSSLVRRFGISVLALVPVVKDDEFAATMYAFVVPERDTDINSIEQIREPDFEEFADLIDVKRGGRGGILSEGWPKDRPADFANAPSLHCHLLSALIVAFTSPYLFHCYHSFVTMVI